MPVINIVLGEAEHKKLQDEYGQLVKTWPQPENDTALPTFEDWAGSRILNGIPASADEVSDIRLFAAIEKLVTSLHLHGFSLAHIAESQMPPAASSLELANLMVHSFNLPPQYLKKMQDVFTYYLKSTKEIAEIGYVGITSHAADTLGTAYRELADRTVKAIEELGFERATGRIEGAIALLVGLHVVDRKTAQEKINAFKLEIRGMKKAGWVGKVFGGSNAVD